jgi:hypothetical protein
MKRWLWPASLFSLLLGGWLYVTYFSVEALPQIASGVNSQGGAFGNCLVDTTGNNMTCPGTITANGIITASGFQTSGSQPATFAGLNGYAFSTPPAAGNDICAFPSGDDLVCEDSAGNLYTAVPFSGTVNNSYAQLQTTGVRLSRNIADANPALSVVQSNASSTGDIARFNNSGAVVAKITQAGFLFAQHIAGGTSAPTGVVGTGGCTGGGSPSATATGTDVTGTISVTTGTGSCVTSAVLVTVSFATAFSTAPFCAIESPSGAVRSLAAAAQPFLNQANVTTGQFVLTTGTTALATGTTYAWNYHCIQ